ncbi:MAG: cupin domain-containing protein [Planctomycetota bacterium]|nr:cupin domain-containing protein [Planctomycetota bacterium]
MQDADHNNLLKSSAAANADASVLGASAKTEAEGPAIDSKGLVTLVRHEDKSSRERSTCGWRYRLISEGDKNNVAWVHVVDIDGAKPHYHKRAIELYYVLEGEGTIRLEGQEHAIRKGSVVQIPPGVVHSGTGRMRVLVVAIPNVKDDMFYPEQDQS